MAKNFSPYLQELLKHEGGYVNHPEDPGGITNLGVTKKVWDEWSGKVTTEDDMKTLTPKVVEPLYKKRYWEAVGAERLPIGLDLCVFDFGVNAGTRRAVRYLQRMIDVKQDGIFGNDTLGAANAYVDGRGMKQAIIAYQSEREDYYKQLKHFPTFGKGWLKRVRQVTKKAIEIFEAWELR